MQTTTVETALTVSPIAIVSGMTDEGREAEAHDDVFAALFEAASGLNGYRIFEANGELHIVRE